MTRDALLIALESLDDAVRFMDKSRQVLARTPASDDFTQNEFRVFAERLNSVKYELELAKSTIREALLRIDERR